MQTLEQSCSSSSCDYYYYFLSYFLLFLFTVVLGSLSSLVALQLQVSIIFFTQRTVPRLFFVLVGIANRFKKKKQTTMDYARYIMVLSIENKKKVWKLCTVGRYIGYIRYGLAACSLLFYAFESIMDLVAICRSDKHMSKHGGVARHR